MLHSCTIDLHPSPAREASPGYPEKVSSSLSQVLSHLSSVWDKSITKVILMNFTKVEGSARLYPVILRDIHNSPINSGICSQKGSGIRFPYE